MSEPVVQEARDGDGIKPLPTKVIPLTREAVEQFRAETVEGFDRDLNESHVEHLTEMTREGLFYGTDWVTAFCKENGHLYRVNGQHSSHTLLQLTPDEFPQGREIVIRRFECETTFDVKLLFGVLDSRFSTRKSIDMTAIHTGQDAELKAIDIALRHAIAGGLNWYARHILLPTFKGEKATQVPDVCFIEPFDLGSILLESPYREYLLEFAVPHAADKNAKLFFGSRALVAESYAEWLAARNGATNIGGPLFWDRILKESDPNPDDLSRTLAEKLRDETKSKKKLGAMDLFLLVKRASAKWARIRSLTDEPMPAQVLN